MSNLNIKNIIYQYPEHEFIVIDGHDNAIVGISTDMRLVYCEDTIIKNLMAEMIEEDAIDFYEYNIASAYIADNQPIIFKKI
jgi:hypothetical protein